MREIYKEIENIIPKENVHYDEDMSKHTTTKVGGKCSCLVEISSIDDIKRVITFALENNIKYYVIGHGSNLLVVDEGIDAVVILIGEKFANITIDGDTIYAEAGASIPKLSNIAKENSLSGLEFACGIPGTLGGAIRMNAGAYGSEMVNIVESVGYLDENLNIVEIPCSKCDFSYRHSMFEDNGSYVILYAKLKLKKGNIDEIDKKMKENVKLRNSKQPIEYPNFGSVFKRPDTPGVYVGKMVEDLGLKGFSIGGAMVSTKHSGFIINNGGATCSDILSVINYIKEKVYEKYGIKLQEEVVILGGKKV